MSAFARIGSCSPPISSSCSATGSGMPADKLLDNAIKIVGAPAAIVKIRMFHARDKLGFERGAFFSETLVAFDDLALTARVAQLATCALPLSQAR
jgi:hypothetical protein